MIAVMSDWLNRTLPYLISTTLRVRKRPLVVTRIKYTPRHLSVCVIQAMPGNALETGLLPVGQEGPHLLPKDEGDGVTRRKRIER